MCVALVRLIQFRSRRVLMSQREIGENI